MGRSELRFTLPYSKWNAKKKQKKNTAATWWLFKLLFTVYDWNLNKMVLDLDNLLWMIWRKLVQSKLNSLQREL